jgi:hypothetical protein
MVFFATHVRPRTRISTKATFDPVTAVGNATAKARALSRPDHAPASPGLDAVRIRMQPFRDSTMWDDSGGEGTFRPACFDEAGGWCNRKAQERRLRVPHEHGTHQWNWQVKCRRQPAAARRVCGCDSPRITSVCVSRSNAPQAAFGLQASHPRVAFTASPSPASHASHGVRLDPRTKPR